MLDFILIIPADNVDSPLWIFHSGKLHNNLVFTLSEYRRLRDTKLVYSVTNCLEGLISGIVLYSLPFPVRNSVYQFADSLNGCKGWVVVFNCLSYLSG